MSSGQLARTPGKFPRMKVRGNRRRRDAWFRSLARGVYVCGVIPLDEWQVSR